MAKKPARKTPAKAAAKKPEPKETFRQKLSDVFEDMWDTIGKHHMAISGRALGGGQPVTDMKKSNRAMTFTLEVPGIDEKDIHVSVSDGLLAISGEKAQDREAKGENFVFQERTFGSFARTFALPVGAKEEDVTAALANGVLTVKVPLAGRQPASDAKRIPIAKK